MRLKLLILLLVAATALFAVDHVWTTWVQPEVMTDVAIRQMERCNQPTRWIRAANHIQQWTELAGILACSAAAAMVVFWNRLRHREASASPAAGGTTHEETNS